MSQDTQRSCKQPSKESAFEAASFFLLLTQIANAQSSQKRVLAQWHKHAEALMSYVKTLGRAEQECTVAGELTELPTCDDAMFRSVLSPLTSMRAVQYAAKGAEEEEDGGIQPLGHQWRELLVVLKAICSSKEFFTMSKRRILAERTSEFFDLLRRFFLSPSREKRSATSPECAEKRRRSAGEVERTELNDENDDDALDGEKAPAIVETDVERVISAVADLISVHPFFLMALSNHSSLWQLLDARPSPGISTLEWKHSQYQFLRLLETVSCQLVVGQEQMLCLLPRIDAYANHASGLVGLYIKRILGQLRQENPAEASGKMRIER